MEQHNELSWEQKALEHVLQASVAEQRRSRRWKIFFRSIYLALFIGIVGFFLMAEHVDDNIIAGPHVAVVDIEGIIVSSSLMTNANAVIDVLGRAFKHADTQAIVLRINSPGGSPVEAARIYDEVLRLREKHPGIDVYAVINDIGASAAYYIASAASEIYANPASIVGSIGVLINSFGFVDLLEKVGVERRLITAGSDKGQLDPFLPMTEQAYEHAESLVDNVHQQFIAAVVEGRGERLVKETDIFTGLVWTGEQAKSLGLIDGFGDTQFVAREVVGVEQIVLFRRPINFGEAFSRLVGLGMAEYTSTLLQQQFYAPNF